MWRSAFSISVARRALIGSDLHQTCASTRGGNRRPRRLPLAQSVVNRIWLRDARLGRLDGLRIHSRRFRSHRSVSLPSSSSPPISLICSLACQALYSWVLAQAASRAANQIRTPKMIPRASIVVSFYFVTASLRSTTRVYGFRRMVLSSARRTLGSTTPYLGMSVLLNPHGFSRLRPSLSPRFLALGEAASSGTDQPPSGCAPPGYCHRRRPALPGEP